MRTLPEAKDMFRIVDIAGGWFTLMLSSETHAFTVSCSSCAGIDVGKQLLDLADGLARKRPIRRYICLNGEQCAYRMELSRRDASVMIQVCEITGGPDASLTAFRFVGATPSALEFAKVKAPVFIGEYGAAEFAKRIHAEFESIDKEAYERNWFPFPQAAYDALTEHMKYRA
ncbi:MAG TPA: hypothetical protein PKE04_11135 [Clostridia bacterium]|nr:hypothetical protein [Clostridia bacterium]